MKLVKLSVFALTMGLFAASCGNGTTEAAKTDSAITTTTTTTEAAPAPATSAPVDTMTAAPAKPAETKMETKTETKTETKKEEKKK